MDFPKIVSASGHLPFEARSTPRSMRAKEELPSDVFRSACAPSNSPGIPQTIAATIITRADLACEGPCIRSRVMNLHYIPIGQATKETHCDKDVFAFRIIRPPVEQWTGNGRSFSHRLAAKRSPNTVFRESLRQGSSEA